MSEDKDINDFEEELRADSYTGNLETHEAQIDAEHWQHDPEEWWRDSSNYQRQAMLVGAGITDLNLASFEYYDLSEDIQRQLAEDSIMYSPESKANEHIITQSNGQRMFECPVCGIFIDLDKNTTYDTLKGHLSGSHNVMDWTDEDMKSLGKESKANEDFVHQAGYPPESASDKPYDWWEGQGEFMIDTTKDDLHQEIKMAGDRGVYDVSINNGLSGVNANAWELVKAKEELEREGKIKRGSRYDKMFEGGEWEPYGHKEPSEYWFDSSVNFGYESYAKEDWLDEDDDAPAVSVEEAISILKEYPDGLTGLEWSKKVRERHGGGSASFRQAELQGLAYIIDSKTGERSAWGDKWVASESKANEYKSSEAYGQGYGIGTPAGDIIWKHFNAVHSMDQDDVFCNHCGKMMTEPVRKAGIAGDGIGGLAQQQVYFDHLKQHGITESHATEGRPLDDWLASSDNYDGITLEDTSQEWWDNNANPSEKARILNKTGSPVENTFDLPSYDSLSEQTKTYLSTRNDFSFESKATEDDINLNTPEGRDMMNDINKHASSGGKWDRIKEPYEKNFDDWNRESKATEKMWECGKCDGTGKDEFGYCYNCKGTGQLSEEEMERKYQSDQKWKNMASQNDDYIDGSDVPKDGFYESKATESLDYFDKKDIIDDSPMEEQLYDVLWAEHDNGDNGKDLYPSIRDDFCRGGMNIESLVSPVQSQRSKNAIASLLRWADGVFKANESKATEVNYDYNKIEGGSTIEYYGYDGRTGELDGSVKKGKAWLKGPAGWVVGGGNGTIVDERSFVSSESKASELQHDEYEVDVDEYIKTGEPVQKVPTDKRSYNVESTTWTNASFNRKLDALESLGIKQGDAVRLASVAYEDLSEDLKKDLELPYTEEDAETEQEIFAQNEEKEEDVDYNNIGESRTARTKYECEHCNCGFKSNESLSIHYNQIHAVAPEPIEGYENWKDVADDLYEKEQARRKKSGEGNLFKRNQEYFDYDQSQDKMVCNRCGATFDSAIYDAVAIRDHADIHERGGESKAKEHNYLGGVPSKLKDTQCPECGSYDSLYEHETHGDLQCEVCGGAFEWEQVAEFNNVEVSDLGESKANEIGIHGGDGASFYDGKTFTCEFCGKVGDDFSIMAQEICPSNNGNGHQVPIFGDQVKPKPIPTLSGESLQSTLNRGFDNMMVMDQSDMFRCKECSQMFDIWRIEHELHQNPEEVLNNHLQSHESYAKEEGTSDGAKKGWLTRKRGGSSAEEPSNVDHDWAGSVGYTKNKADQNRASDLMDKYYELVDKPMEDLPVDGSAMEMEERKLIHAKGERAFQEYLTITGRDVGQDVKDILEDENYHSLNRMLDARMETKKNPYDDDSQIRSGIDYDDDEVSDSQSDQDYYDGITQTTMETLQQSTVNGFPFFSYIGKPQQIFKDGKGGVVLYGMKRNPNSVRKVDIIYDEGADTYSVRFVSNRGKVKGEYSDIYFDQLSNIIVGKKGLGVESKANEGLRDLCENCKEGTHEYCLFDPEGSGNMCGCSVCGNDSYEPNEYQMMQQQFGSDGGSEISDLQFESLGIPFEDIIKGEATDEDDEELDNVIEPDFEKQYEDDKKQYPEWHEMGEPFEGEASDTGVSPERDYGQSVNSPVPSGTTFNEAETSDAEYEDWSQNKTDEDTTRNNLEKLQEEDGESIDEEICLDCGDKFTDEKEYNDHLNAHRFDEGL